jgi:Mor family transcriptional regulator
VAEQHTMLDALTCDPLDLIEHAGDDMPNRARWPEKMAELFDIEYSYNTKQGMSEDDAAADAAARVILICDYLGGSVTYLPRGDTLRQAVRDSAAYRRHTGRNTESLARELGITTTNFYALLARERKRRVRKMQGRLFEE